MKFKQDSMNETGTPADVLYGAHTQKAMENFKISELTPPFRFIKALAQIKGAAALTNKELGHLKAPVASAIYKAAKEVEAGLHDSQFPIDLFQTGSGTSTNMNANEVIAHLASKQIKKPVSPNDDVNLCQSSNDVIPSAIHISACLSIKENLLPALDTIIQSINKRRKELNSVVKTGRTHLMDATPVTFGQELGGWMGQLKSCRSRIKDSMKRLRMLALGGTAVGTGLNTIPGFAKRVVENISKQTGFAFKPASNKFEVISSQDTAVEMSGQLKTLAVAIIKISNDLRWMNSGPITGLGEISLPALQPGSSIMPGKVNPVIPEAAAMAGAQVIGNDATIAIAGQSGNFQLNVMLPLVAHNLLQSISLCSNSLNALAEKAINGFKVDMEKINKDLCKNPILVTALNPIIGYEKGARIARKAYQEGRPILDTIMESVDIDENILKKLIDPLELTRGGSSEKL